MLVIHKPLSLSLYNNIHIPMYSSQLLDLKLLQNTHQPFFCLDKILPVHLMSIVNSRTFSILHVIEE